MKKTSLKTMSIFLILLCTMSFMSCSSNDDNGNPDSIDNPDPNPVAEFDKNDFEVTVLDIRYEPGDSEFYVNFTVKNLNTTKSYDGNDEEWDILFKVKATDGYEFSNYVSVLSVEPESTYEHGLPIYVSTGKTIDVSTLTYEIIPHIED